jgi:hypothetical protein
MKVFFATNGAANGMTSTDIGLQKTEQKLSVVITVKRNWNKISDFTWQTMTGTYGAINSGQSFSTVKIPLVAPSNVVASNITATTLSWDAVTGAVSYEIYNGTTLVAATTNSSFTINNLIANTDYNFTVLALDADDNTSPASANVPVKL